MNAKEHREKCDGELDSCEACDRDEDGQLFQYTEYWCKKCHTVIN